MVYAASLTEIVRDPGRLERTIADAGAWGPIVFVALMIILVAPGLPGVAFVLLASNLWPRPMAIALVVLGGTGASSLRFFFVRRVGRAWVEARLPPRLQIWDDRLAKRGTWAVIAIRLLLNMAAPADWALGLSRITTRQFLVGTVVGRTPVAVAWVVAGTAFFTATQSFVWIAATIAAGLIIWLTLRRRTHRRGVRASNRLPLENVVQEAPLDAD